RMTPDPLAPVVDAVWPGMLCGGWRTSRQREHTTLLYASFLILAQLLSAASALAQGAVQERRIALVIGNSAYRQAPLLNPLNDAQAMATTLRSLGFAMTVLENASRGQMDDAIRKFGDSIKNGGVGLFFFAGHGVQVQGKNFLIPVDADIERED